MPDMNNLPASHKPVAEITTRKKAPRKELSKTYLKTAMQTSGATIIATDPATNNDA